MSSWAATGRVRGPYGATDRDSFFPVPEEVICSVLKKAEVKGLRGRGQGEVVADAIRARNKAARPGLITSRLSQTLMPAHSQST